MIADNVEYEWGIHSTKMIEAAQQVHLHEFIKSDEIVSHIWRLTGPQFIKSQQVQWEINARCRDVGYETAKLWFREYLVNAGVDPLSDSQCRIKRFSPTKWFAAMRPDAADLSSRAERFGVWYAAKFGVLIPPTAVLSGDEIPALYCELPASMHEPMGSCMTGPDRSQFTVVYATSPRCKMLIHRGSDGKCDERVTIFLPDDMPEDTPVGAGWWFSRIYNIGDKDCPVDRSILGPWMIANGMKSVTAAGRYMTVSGFKLGPDRYLPYVDKDCHVRIAWDMDEAEPGDPVFFEIGIDHRPFRRPAEKYYPSSQYDNNYGGGPDWDGSLHNCVDCGCRVHDEDVRYPEDCSDPYCEECYHSRYTYCEVSGHDVYTDNMIPVHGARYIDSADRHLRRFRWRPAGSTGDHRIEFTRICLISDGEAYVPTEELSDDGEHWMHDLEHHGWMRQPTLVVETRDDGWTMFSNDAADEDRWSWAEPGVSHETADGEEMWFTFFSSRYTHVVQCAREWNMAMKFNTDTGVMEFHRDGMTWLPIPILRECPPMIYVNGQSVMFNAHDRSHHKHVPYSMVSRFEFVPVQPQAPVTGETASTL